MMKVAAKGSKPQGKDVVQFFGANTITCVLSIV